MVFCGGNPRSSVIVVYVIDYRCGTFCYRNGKSNRGTRIVVKRFFFVGENHRGRCICNICTTNTAVFFVMGQATKAKVVGVNLVMASHITAMHA